MSRTGEIFIFRHGQTDWNIEGRIQGHLDIPLNDTGREQARSLIEPLRRLKIQALLASDLSRASETAAIIAESLRLPLFNDSGLRETHLGKLQGLTWKEASEQLGEGILARIRNKPLSDEVVADLGSETGEQVLSRCLAAFKRFFQTQSFHRIGLCCHGGVIRTLIRHALEQEELPPSIMNCTVFPMLFEVETGKLHVESFSKLQ